MLPFFSTDLTSTRIPHLHLHFHPLPSKPKPQPLSFSASLSFPPLRSRTDPRWQIHAYTSDDRAQGNDLYGDLSFVTALTAAEVVCLVPPAICSMVCLIGLALPHAASKKLQLYATGKLFSVQYFFLVCGVLVGILIRWRQWRFFRVIGRSAGDDLVGRIEKVEEDLRNMSTIVAVVSRKLEKLDVRFRVTRRALKEPITEVVPIFNQRRLF